VQARKVNVSQVGDRTTLSLRPERVMIEPKELVNTFEAEVKELIYLGDHIRTRVRLCDNDDFVIKIPNAQNHALLAVGDTVKVGWAVDDCRALDA
jgi:putative spermidine/putrescine transport system ATP-binding protein